MGRQHPLLSGKKSVVTRHVCWAHKGHTCSPTSDLCRLTLSHGVTYMIMPFQCSWTSSWCSFQHIDPQLSVFACNARLVANGTLMLQPPVAMASCGLMFVFDQTDGGPTGGSQVATVCLRSRSIKNQKLHRTDHRFRPTHAPNPAVKTARFDHRSLAIYGIDHRFRFTY